MEGLQKTGAMVSGCRRYPDSPRSTQPPVAPATNTDVGETQTRCVATLNWLNQY